MMEIIRFDVNEKLDSFKVLNGTNGGPIHSRHNPSQHRSNFSNYKAARIPYARNHDSGLESIYGGPYSHDISAIFPDFDADVNDPASYDFACTDESILVCLDAGTKTFFRLGQSIEHQIKKHFTVPPKDFKKWSVICEHIIRHYTEGWADGFHHDMPYWEIWCEPDIDEALPPEKRATWGGTREQFYDLFETAAKHLKICFPHLKIGGPAIGYNVSWADAFLTEMQKRQVPIDFFSWHSYPKTPIGLKNKADAMRNLLDKYGYAKTELILDEWNYVKGWRDEFVYSIECIHGMKGAAFNMACMSEGQKSSIDMMMYYDMRPCVFNGAFDFYTLRPLKGYYPFYWYGMFYDMQSEIRSKDEHEDIYTLCGVDDKGKILCTVTYFTDEDNKENKEIKIEFGKEGRYEVYLLDENHNGELEKTVTELAFTMKPNSLIMIKEV